MTATAPYTIIRDNERNAMKVLGRRNLFDLYNAHREKLAFDYRPAAMFAKSEVLSKLGFGNAICHFAVGEPKLTFSPKTQTATRPLPQGSQLTGFRRVVAAFAAQNKH